MEEFKRENSKVKRGKSEVKNAMSLYLHKRNYCSVTTSEASKSEQMIESLVEKGLGRPNSIMYSCSYNSDPVAIDHDFTKFLLWLKDETKNKNRCYDLEQMIGLLFCHLYIDILNSGHSERGTTFFKNHISSIDESKCDDTLKELINLINSKSDISDEIDRFRSKKATVELSTESLHLFKKFILQKLENCHVVFLKVLQTWFDFKISDETNVDLSEEVNVSKNIFKYNFAGLLKVIEDLEKEPLPIYNVAVCATKETVTCGLLKRQCGLVAIAENNIARLLPLHTYDNLLNLESANEAVRLTNHSDRIYSMDVSFDNKTLVTCSADNTICIYNLANMVLVKKCHGHLGPVYCVEISGRGEFIASGSMDTTARLWESATGKTVRVFIGHKQSVTCLAFHPNCLYLATGSADRNVRLWCVNKASTLRLLYGAKGCIFALSFDPLGKMLASASDDKKVRLWDLLTSKVTVELKHKESQITKLIWNPAGTELCTGTSDSTIHIWDLKNVKEDWENGKCLEPTKTESLGGKLLWLEFMFGHYGTLTAET